MTKDYSYEGMDVTLDSDDRALNTPTALPQSDYPLDVVKDESWPGMQAPADGIQFDPDAAEQVATWLENQATGPLADVASRLARGSAVSFGPPSWREAAHLQEASTQVSAAVTTFTAQLVQNLREAAASIKAAKQTYSNADQAGQQGARAVDANIRYSSGSSAGEPPSASPFVPKGI